MGIQHQPCCCRSIYFIFSVSSPPGHNVARFDLSSGQFVETWNTGVDQGALNQGIRGAGRSGDGAVVAVLGATSGNPEQGRVQFFDADNFAGVDGPLLTPAPELAFVPPRTTARYSATWVSGVLGALVTPDGTPYLACGGAQFSGGVEIIAIRINPATGHSEALDGPIKAMPGALPAAHLVVGAAYVPRDGKGVCLITAPPGPATNGAVELWQFDLDQGIGTKLGDIDQPWIGSGRATPMAIDPEQPNLLWIAAVERVAAGANTTFYGTIDLDTLEATQHGVVPLEGRPAGNYRDWFF